MKIAFPKRHQTKFCLVGSGKVLTSFARLLIDNGFPPPVGVTWKKELHSRDVALLGKSVTYENVLSFCQKAKIEIVEAENINDTALLDQLVEKGVDVLFSVSSRWIIKQHVIELFKNNVFSIHAGYLPKGRGSAVYAKILNESKYLGVTIHAITPDVDAGLILLRVREARTKNTKTIQQVTQANIRMSITLLTQFTKQICDEKEFDLIPQNIDDGIYMPQPFTEENGFIDWRWSANQIEVSFEHSGNPCLER